MTRTLMGSRGVNDLRTLDATSPFGFLAQPSDIGKAVAFLCSEGGRYITGERLTVSGGRF
jgi:3-oxoacyl-[acyl-carrier protein] reductase